MLTKAIAAGAGLIFPDTTDLPRMWESIAAERPTWMYCSPGYLELLARLLRERPALPAPSSLRFVRVSSAPLSLEVCEELETRLGAPILPSYGTSEAGRITAVLPPPAPRKPGSDGRPVQEVRIVADDGSDVGPGVAGEIWVRGPLVFAGYLDDPENNAARFTADGWFRTGDLGYLDADGFFFLTGRINELINRGGTKIVPGEVDEALLDHPAVAEAAVFGVPDARLGEDIVAAVVLKPGLDATAREFRGWLLDRLSPHKVPRRIWFVAEAASDGEREGATQGARRSLLEQTDGVRVRAYSASGRKLPGRGGRRQPPAHLHPSAPLLCAGRRGKSHPHRHIAKNTARPLSPAPYSSFSSSASIAALTISSTSIPA